MSLTVAELNVKMMADVSGLKSGVAQANAQVKGFEEQTKKTSANVGSAFQAVAGAIAAAGIVEGIHKIIEVTNEEAQSHARLVQTMGNVTGATEAVIGATETWITKQAEATGFTKGQMTDALNIAVLATHNLADSQKIVATAEDMARAKGIDLTTATNILSKAHEGNTMLLVRQFPELLKLKAGNASAAEMVDYLTLSVKGQADAFANTSTGQMARFKVSLQELEVSIGNVLIPVLGTLATVGTDVLGFFQHHAEAAAVLAGIIGGPLAVALGIYIAKKTLAFAEDVIGVISSTARAITGVLIPAIVGATAAEEGFGAMEAIVTVGLSVLAGGAALVAFHVLAAKAAVTDTTGAMGEAGGTAQGLVDKLNGVTNSTDNVASALDKARTEFMAVYNAQQSYAASLRTIDDAQAAVADSEAKLHTLLTTHGVDVKAVTSATNALNSATKSQTTAQGDLDAAIQKLNADMKPATIEAMTTAQDRLLSSTLDLQDANKSLADAIKHRDDIAKALATGTSLDPASTDDLTIAQGAANDAFTAWQSSLSDGKSTIVDVARAHKNYTDALRSLTDLQKQGTVTADDLAAASEEVQRKTINLDGATSSLSGSQSDLNDLMHQGAENDPQIIADRQAIADKTAALNTATANVAQSQTALNTAMAGDPMLKQDIASLRKDVADKTQALADAQHNAAAQAIALDTSTTTLQTDIQNGKVSRDDFLQWVNDVESHSPGAATGLNSIASMVKGLKLSASLDLTVATITLAPQLAAELAKDTGNILAGATQSPVVGNQFISGIPGVAPITLGVSLSGRAAGGPVSAGTPYWVGEHGPEVFMPGQSGSIVPNGGGGSTYINITVNALDPQGASNAVMSAIKEYERRSGTSWRS